MVAAALTIILLAVAASLASWLFSQWIGMRARLRCDARGRRRRNGPADRGGRVCDHRGFGLVETSGEFCMHVRTRRFIQK